MAESPSLHDAPPLPDPFCFGNCELHVADRQLRVDGSAVPLGGRAFDLLVVLAARRDRLVSKSELLDLVWPGLIVEENNLQVHVSALRRLLGLQAIATVPGRGYRFTPNAQPVVTPATQPGARRAPVAAGTVPSAAAPARLLVADDNKVNRLLLARSLELLGYQVVSVDNGRAALEKLRRERLDLLLLDLEMPELDGFGLLEQMAADAELCDLPVIVTSSLEGVAQVARCIELGADDYLRKPVNPVLLKARVGASLEKKRLRDEQKDMLRRLSGGTGAPMVPTGSPRGARVPATLLCVGVQELQALSQQAAPEAVFEMLDAWMTLMREAIDGGNGVITQLGADRLTAIFGAPLAPPRGGDAALGAVRAALDMLEMSELFNAERRGAGLAPVTTAIGIATGEAVVGWIGRLQQVVFGSLGAPVQAAAALQARAASVGATILLDGPTQAAVRERVSTTRLAGDGADAAFIVQTG